MGQSSLTLRRSLLIGLVAVGLTPLAGCMSKPVRPASADGTSCFAIGKWNGCKLTGTTEPIPSKQVEAAAKQFEVKFVELVGSIWSWGSSYRLERGDPTESRARAAPLRLVADLG